MLLKEGTVAPEFLLPSHRGESVRLSALQGRPVLIWFYPKADTPG